MNSGKSETSFLKGRNIILVVCIVIILALIVGAIIAVLSDGTGSMKSREEITALMAEHGDADLGHKYVANHITEYGIGGFDAGRLRNVEYYFNSNYAKELPSLGDLAYSTAELFMTHYYDRVDHSDRDTLTTAIIHCYVESTGDEYAVYRTAEELEVFTDDMSGSFVGIGVSVLQTVDPITGLLTEVRVEDVINGSGAKDAGILPGDLIISVDGEAVTGFDNNGLVSKIRGEKGTSVAIGVLRGDEELSFSCERRQVIDLTVEYRVDGKIGFIEITSFKSNTDELFEEALTYMYSMNVEGIVFDVRNNPGGYLDSVLNVLDMMVGADTPLASYVDAGGREVVYESTGIGAPLAVPAVVICNEYTASAGELFTAAMRDYNAMGILKARVVGVNTYGKGVMQTTYSFLDGASITLTSAFYNPPSGVNYDGVGVKPDKEISPSDEGDAQLDGALKALGELITQSGGGMII